MTRIAMIVIQAQGLTEGKVAYPAIGELAQDNWQLVSVTPISWSGNTYFDGYGLRPSGVCVYQLLLTFETKQ